VSSLVLVSARATHCVECQKRRVVFTRLELCWSCYVRLRDKGVCVGCRVNFAALGKKGRCAECWSEKMARRRRREHGEDLKAFTPRMHTVAPLKGTVEVRSVECPRFAGELPAATCLAEQRSGCSCERGLRLNSLGAAGVRIASEQTARWAGD
jgi:hypothetical protein